MRFYFVEKLIVSDFEVFEREDTLLLLILLDVGGPELSFLFGLFKLIVIILSFEYILSGILQFDYINTLCHFDRFR